MKIDIDLALRALWKVKEKPRECAGICQNFYYRYKEDWGRGGMEEEGIKISFGEAIDFLDGYFKRWPKFSGDIEYPVPHPERRPREAYDKSLRMWERDTEYGKNRWELLEFIIGEVEKACHKEKKRRESAGEVFDEADGSGEGVSSQG